MMTTNLDSAYFLSKALHPRLARSSRGAAVVHVSSAAGLTSTGTGAIYGMTKVRSILRAVPRIN